MTMLTNYSAMGNLAGNLGANATKLMDSSTFSKGPKIMSKDWWKGFMENEDLWGGSDADGNEKLGAINTGIDAVTGIGSLYMGMKQYNLAKQSFKQKQKEFDMNMTNQKKLTNAELNDRQRARVAANPTGAESVTDYMKKYGV